jgi:hypothetical protein
MLILQFCVVIHKSKANWIEKRKNKPLTRNVKCVHWRERQWNKWIQECILSEDLAEVEANATRTSVRSAQHYVPGLCQQFAVARTLHNSISLSNATLTYGLQSDRHSYRSRHNSQSYANTFTAFSTVIDKELPQCVFIYSLLNDTVFRSDYVTSNGRFTDQQSTGKDVEQNGRNFMSVTDDRGSNPDQWYARRRDRQIYISEE